MRLSSNNQPNVNNLAYQSYYRLGLRQVLGRHVQDVVPGLVRPVGRWAPPAVICAMTECLAVQHYGFCASDEHVGQYLWFDESSGRRVKFAIDAHDRKEIHSPSILGWSDVYFKSNKWTTLTYPDKVLPIVNGCRLSAREIQHLISLRALKKTCDLTFVARVWGGKEHVIRMFEQLVTLDCQKKLLAILMPEQSPEGRRLNKAYGRRLDAAKVPWITEAEYGRMHRGDLWEWYARSALVVLRSGRHLAIPWRMIELLAMGSCIIYDAIPLMAWPVPLEPDVHYLTLGIPRPVEGSTASWEYYERIPDLIRRYLDDTALQERIRGGAQRYFDDVASPARVATYILRQIEGGLHGPI